MIDLSEGGVRSAAAASTPSEASGGAFDPRFRPSVDGSPVPYVIVTGQALAAEFQRLADWKTRSGTPAVVRTVEWVRQNYPDGVDLQEQIRDFLRDAVTYWGTEWVLLGGDTPVVPVRYGYSSYYGSEQIPTDLYYQCLDGNWNANGNTLFGEGISSTNPGNDDQADLLPDLWVGRLPVSTVEQARSAVDKTITYETAPPVDANYPASALLLAEVLFPPVWQPGVRVDYDGAILAEETAGFLPSAFRTVRLYENSTAYAGAAPESISAVIREIDRGYGVIHHVGHGYIDNMRVGVDDQSLQISDVDQFTNGNRTSVLYAINCTSAAVDFDCIAEHVLNNSKGGSVAVVGSTRLDFPGTSHFYDAEFYRLLFRPTTADGPGMDRLGKAAALAKVPFVPVSAWDQTHRWTQFDLIYLGDPELKIWRAAPTALTVTRPGSLSVGPAPVTVQVRANGTPVDSARVTWYREGDCFASGLTGASGSATLTVDPGTTGSLALTVTGGEHLPYLAEVPVAAAAAAAPKIDEVAVSDPAPGGNGNGLLEAGESAVITFTVGNHGGTAISGAVLSAGGAGTTLTLTPVVAGPVAVPAGGRAAFTFQAAADPGAPAAAEVAVPLQLTAGGTTWPLSAPVPVGAPRLAIYGLTLAEASGNGNGIPEPGEEITVTPSVINRGAGASLPLTGTLELVSAAGASLTRAAAGYGAVPADSVGPGSGFQPFTLRLGSGTTRPTVRFRLNDGFRDRLDAVLDLVPPPAPTAVQTVGAAARVTLTWTDAAASDVARYVVYRSSAAAGPFTRVSGYLTSRYDFYVDSPLQGFDPLYYRVAAQDSSGNLSPPGAPVRGTPAIPILAGFPLQSGQGSQSSVVAADLDGDGVTDLITAREQIYAFHADGTELRDGDSDARTLGPWTSVATNSGFWATPAVGDLFGDGRLEVVAISFQEGQIYVWDRNGRLLPGWPRSTDRPSVLALGSPILADLDGDGTLEIVVNAGTSVYAYDRFGQEVVDGDHDPATKGVFFHTGYPYSYGTPAVGDLDGDGIPEVVVPVRGQAGNPPHYGKVYVLEPDGGMRPGWPVTFFQQVTSSPALADLSGDGKLEVVVATGSDSLEVREPDGSSLPGWPRPVQFLNQDLDSSPAVADVDNDGSLDIAVGTSIGRIYLWHADGTLFPGFPYTFTNSLGKTAIFAGSPVLANLDDDDDLEIAIGNKDGWIAGLNRDATPVLGFPVKIDGPMDGSVLVADVDGDGVNEMAVSGFDKAIYLYRTLGRPTSNPGWPTFHHDPMRTGNLTVPVTVGGGLDFAAAVLQTPLAPQEAAVYVVASKKLRSPPP